MTYRYEEMGGVCEWSFERGNVTLSPAMPPTAMFHPYNKCPIHRFGDPK
jgi:hypothetical protein